MTQTSSDTRCTACGHTGGALAATRSPEFDAIASAHAPGLVVVDEIVCAGALFADDGPTACLHRMTAKR